MSTKRILTIDLVKFISIFPIVFFHTHEVFYEDLPISKATSLFYKLLWGSQYLSFSGHSIILISSFLLAKNHFDRLKRQKLLIFLFASTALLYFSYFLRYEFEWDIYQLLIFCVFYSFVITSKKNIKPFIFFNFVVMLVPFWNVELLKTIPEFIQAPLIGICEKNKIRGLWPLLPWAGFFGFFYGLGCLYYHGYFFKKYLEKLNKVEVIVWPVLLIPSLYFWGSYFDVQIGNQYYCFINRKPFYVLWSHLIWVIFILRFGFVKRVNEAIMNRFTLWVSNLNWNRSFGICYLTHLCIINLSVFFKVPLLANEVYFNLFILMIIPGTEVIVKTLKKYLGQGT